MTVTRKLTLSKNRIALTTGIYLETRSVTFQEEMRMNAKIHSNQYLYYAIKPLIATIFLIKHLKITWQQKQLMFLMLTLIMN